MTTSISQSFRPQGELGYISVSPSGGPGSPPLNIAYTAKNNVVESADLKLPEGYNYEVLDRICWFTGYVEKEVLISGRQGAELRDIGAQLLSLDSEGLIQPPLKPLVRLSIQTLVDVVNFVETVSQAE